MYIMIRMGFLFLGGQFLRGGLRSLRTLWYRSYRLAGNVDEDSLALMFFL